MAESICDAFESTAKRLMDLGLGYLTLDRSAATLSTGERQRMQLARAVRNRTTGVLYVLDEPSIGLHPANIVGLTGVMHDLVADGNSVILVDHDTQILKESDWIIEMGPQAGAKGGHVIAQGPVNALESNPQLTDRAILCPARPKPTCVAHAARDEMFSQGSDSPVHRKHSHSKAPGNRHSQGTADRRHRRVGFGQNHHGAGKPDSRAGSQHCRGRRCPPTFGRSAPRASRTSS